MPSAIVVGGGLSGLSAAHTMIQGGVKVTLFERNAFLGGNSTKATSGMNGGGTRTQKAMGVDDSPDIFLEDMLRSATGQKTGPRPASYPLAEVFANNAGKGVEWVQDEFGLALDTVSYMGGHTKQRTHRTLAGGKFPGMEITSALMKKYEKLADADDGTCDLFINSILTGLIQDEAGCVVGINYTDADGNAAEMRSDCVILACGGYGAGGAVAGSLLEIHRPDLMHLPTTNGDHSQGDGIKAGQGIGAKCVALQHVQVHPTGLVNPADPDNKTKFLAAEALRGEGGIILDREGNRFCNDLGKRDYVSGSMWDHDKAPYRLILNTKAAKQLEWHCHHYVSRRVMKHFKSGAELAGEIGIPEADLKASLDSYNSFAEAGEDPIGGKTIFMNTPFEMHEDYYVAVVTPVVHYTMGGLAISPKCELVYEESSTTIPGVYAAGELTGGVHGRNRLGGSGLAECVVLGRVAGAAALDYVNGPRPKAAPGVGGPSTTTVISIPQANGLEPITVTTTTGGSAGSGKAIGEHVDVIEWDDEVTTQVGKLTAGADGAEGKKAALAAAAVPSKKAPSGPATDVAVVFGSFFMQDSERDAGDLLGMFPADKGLSVSPAAIAGNDFDFNNLKDTKFLVVCTSSMYGNPPKNFWEFYFHLKAASENPNKPLKGLQHTVYGNGDETYMDTYMNVPRMVDTLLERAGSRRFFARGETSEPHAPLGLDMVEAENWGPGMWEAMLSADVNAPAVAWDAHWEGTKPNHHQDVTDWDLKKLEKKFGAPADGPSIFAFAAAKL